jgi:hypothetical protein
MSYTHKGKALKNGVIDPGIIQSDSSELIVNPNDDGLHIHNYNIGDFEWWYFDLLDQDSGYFLKIVFHIGTDPLKRSIFPQLAVSVNTKDSNQYFTKEYKLSDIHAGINHCEIKAKDEIHIWTDNKKVPKYHIKINIHEFKCELLYASEIEGWKPLGEQVQHELDKKKGFFSWIIPQPKAIVKGEFIFDDELYLISSAIGYHDHNYNLVDKAYPLHLDELITHWYWGKCYAEDYTLIFMDTWCKTNRTSSLMVARRNKIIYSSNNLTNCTTESEGYDKVLKVKYPVSIVINSIDEVFPFELRLDKNKILDSKDLIETVHPFLKWLIKKLIAKPAYHGILAKAQLKIGNEIIKGTGNYESMVFRNKAIMSP